MSRRPRRGAVVTPSALRASRRRTLCRAVLLAAAAVVVAVVGLLAGGCGGDSSPAATTPSAAATAQRPDQTAKLTLRQAIGQRMVFAYSGRTPPAALVKRIRRGEAAGVILFARNVGGVTAVRRQVDRLQKIPRPAAVDAPLLVMIDQEGGPVRRLPGSPVDSAAQTKTTNKARANGAAAGRLLRSAGVNVDLAPVVDVARPGSAMEREGRTYGRDAATVEARAGAFSLGLEKAGVQPVLKHFPGFGAATVNTDDGAARVDLPLSTLRAIDNRPYLRLRPRAVMVSTAIYPRVDPRPAAFSRRWVTTELRGTDRLTGAVVMTDDLQAAAVAKYGTPAQLAFFAISAGVDLPLFAQDYSAGAKAASGLERAVKSGALSRADLDAGARRVLAWRVAIGKDDN